ncbi:phosphoribosylamine--glycine ligase [Microbacterium sediminis]|uniref:Phosphoribosylamine--glycine ligase n=1 Tax=Microbacterium sediminis TaxID=904291 RepID=A0A1B9NAB5_9MICO|nr:phosphoribosylamine--glycine ligase [Microbacterium sediminis]OCG73561.1 phosphoribosylamine--glycine ligase [Microbacterium sediminis]QBR73236.1 phosphoribosylamine--glycine ligase [Microbacterium sediminis]
MKILVLGSGAREHAIVLALRSEPTAHEILAAPGNAGIAQDARIVDLDMLDPVAVSAYAIEHAVDLVVVGPEAPLVAGVADALRERGIPVFGPGKAAAQLEGSKAFAKRIMESAGVPTGRAARAGTAEEVAAALDAFGAPYVVKADGLAAGKGVIVTSDREAALAHAAQYLPSGAVLIEEFLSGPEVSLFFLSDGDTVRALSPAQDFKRALDGDAGPNTGGMGAYSPLPWLAERFGGEAEFVAEVTERVALPVIRQLDAEGTPFVGLLYAGLILTESGVKVIEFNARFGDPETQVVLPRLRTPLSELLLAAARGTLEDAPAPEFADDVAVTVVLASEGYPEAPITGRPLGGLAEAATVEGVHLAHAATRAEGDGLVATGGRVLNVVATAPDFATARERAYAAIDRITLEGSHHRRDIAARVV